MLQHRATLGRASEAMPEPGSPRQGLTRALLILQTPTQPAWRGADAALGVRPLGSTSSQLPLSLSESQGPPCTAAAVSVTTSATENLQDSFSTLRSQDPTKCSPSHPECPESANEIPTHLVQFFISDVPQTLPRGCVALSPYSAITAQVQGSPEAGT